MRSQSKIRNDSKLYYNLLKIILKVQKRQDNFNLNPHKGRNLSIDGAWRPKTESGCDSDECTFFPLPLRFPDSNQHEGKIGGQKRNRKG